ncbi:hypothetical protein ALI144C_36745 [Actinosynnema sp. ALI-1.44]|uniref:SAM-dependent methyltransferase n=1 Tax=Actinosynnema sp. ALI-1.44 TaxID=1933779 RepID=UPI00097C1574|nr:methyltransferase domain-containing protein [Actinosynnema sp. ALI-1.44]ONI76220.1 hypothetical protein ALI144C_36745 [Actinosynnema sp. ALI-1.44]
MSTDTHSSDGVRELYEWMTDLMTETHGGHLHGGYWAGPDVPQTVTEAGDRLTDVVVKRCELKPGHHVLDVGSGNGNASTQVAIEHRVRVSGVTVSEYQVQVAQQLADKRGLAGTVSFSVADMRDMPFDDATFDAAFAIESVCHVPDRTNAYAEIGRVLRPGGRVVVTDFMLRQPITDPATAALFATASTTFETAPIVPRAEYESLVRAAGLEVVEVADITEAVQPSWRVAAENMRKAWHTHTIKLGEREYHELVDTLERFGACPELGYVVVVARKPA